MGNDLKYGLVLGAVVLLIFVGYYAIRSRSAKEEMKQPLVAKRAEAPKEVDIFAAPGAETAPSSTNATGGGPEVTIMMGQPTDTSATSQPVGPIAPGGIPGVLTTPTGTPVGNPPTGQPPVLRSVGPGTSALPPTGQPPVLRSVGPGTALPPTGQPPVLRPAGGGNPPLTSVVTPPPAAKTETYKIQKGDTLGRISAKYYGTPDKWQKILDANKSKNLNPNNLVVGTEITIPDAGAQGATTAAKAAAPTPAAGGKTYTVAQGDTLYSISKKFYGDGTQWRKIYDANKSKLPKPDALAIGMTLTIP